MLVFEDLYWIDLETQARLDSLVEGLPAAQLLLLVNYRTQYQPGWGSKTYYRQLQLDPLPPESADTFLDVLLGGAHGLAALTQLPIKRTESNPFFLEECVRSLVETGTLVGERGAYRLATASPIVQVPATVQAVLAVRIDRLAPVEKCVLQTAAVIGARMPWPLLHAIADVPAAELYRGPVYLQAAEFLYETSLFPEHTYTFKHALTHEVAYSSPLHEWRRALHACMVEALKVLTGDPRDEQVERLAHHAMRGKVWEKAVAYYRQSRATAMARDTNHEVVTYFEQGLIALAHVPNRREAREQTIDTISSCNGGSGRSANSRGCWTISSTPTCWPRRLAISSG